MMAQAEHRRRARRAEPGFRFCQGLLHRYTNDPRAALKAFNFARREGEWAERALTNMVEVTGEPRERDVPGRAASSTRGTRATTPVLAAEDGCSRAADVAAARGRSRARADGPQVGARSRRRPRAGELHAAAGSAARGGLAAQGEGAGCHGASAAANPSRERPRRDRRAHPAPGHSKLLELLNVEREYVPALGAFHRGA